MLVSTVSVQVSTWAWRGTGREDQLGAFVEQGLIESLLLSLMFDDLVRKGHSYLNMLYWICSELEMIQEADSELAFRSTLVSLGSPSKTS